MIYRVKTRKEFRNAPPELPHRLAEFEHTKLGSNQDRILTEEDVRNALWHDFLAANEHGDIIVIDVVKGAFERVGHIIEELAPAAQRSIVLSAKTAESILMVQANRNNNPKKKPLLPTIQPGNPNIKIWKPRKRVYSTQDKEMFTLFGAADVNTLYSHPQHYILLRENETPLKLQGLGTNVTYIVSMYAPYSETARQEKRDRQKFARSQNWKLIDEGRHASGHTPVVRKTHPIAKKTALFSLRLAKAHVFLPIHGEHPGKAAQIVREDYVEPYTYVVDKQSHPYSITTAYDPDNPSVITTR